MLSGMSEHLQLTAELRELGRWARRLSPAELELWALSGGPGHRDLPRQAAALTEIKRRDRKIVWRQLLVTALTMFAAWGAGAAAIFGLYVLNGTLSATKKAASAAENQAATSQAQLRLSERPWVLATHEIDSPLTFQQNGYVTLVLKETWQNSGQSAAIDVGSWADIIPLGHGHDRVAALTRQSEYCDAHRAAPKIGEPTGYVLFPKHERTTTTAMALTPDQVKKAIAESVDAHKRIAVAVVGCIWYRTLFEPDSDPAHQTRFAYSLARPIGPPRGTVAALSSGIDVGYQPMLETTKGVKNGLELMPDPEGNYAD